MNYITIRIFPQSDLKVFTLIAPLNHKIWMSMKQCYYQNRITYFFFFILTFMQACKISGQIFKFVFLEMQILQIRCDEADVKILQTHYFPSDFESRLLLNVN